MNKNLSAFLRVIREGETNQTDTAYRMHYGGTLFDSFARHPNKAITLNGITSTAAGAYQFLYRTWQGLGLPDFSPENQDKGAIMLIQRRGAYNDVINGNFETAIRKCNKEWASFPGSPYGQHTISMERCRRIYEQYGGTYGLQEAQRQEADQKVTEDRMSPFIPIALEALSTAIPKLADIFGGTGNSSKNAKAAEVVVNIAKEAVGAVNEQELVQELQRNPESVKAAKEAVEAHWYEIVEAGGGGIAGARQYATDSSDKPMYTNPSFIVSMLLLPLVYMTVSAVLFGENWNDDIRIMVVTAVISGVLGAITGFWLGTSFGSFRKTDMMKK